MDRFGDFTKRGWTGGWEVVGPLLGYYIQLYCTLHIVQQHLLNFAGVNLPADCVPDLCVQHPARSHQTLQGHRVRRILLITLNVSNTEYFSSLSM